MKKGIALLIIAPLLVIAVAPAVVLNSNDTGQPNGCDDCFQLFAIATPLFLLDYDPERISIHHSPGQPDKLPQAPPSAIASRAPPA